MSTRPMHIANNLLLVPCWYCVACWSYSPPYLNNLLIFFIFAPANCSFCPCSLIIKAVSWAILLIKNAIFYIWSSSCFYYSRSLFRTACLSLSKKSPLWVPKSILSKELYYGDLVDNLDLILANFFWSSYGSWDSINFLFISLMF